MHWAGDMGVECCKVHELAMTKGTLEALSVERYVEVLWMDYRSMHIHSLDGTEVTVAWGTICHSELIWLAGFSTRSAVDVMSADNAEMVVMYVLRSAPFGRDSGWVKMIGHALGTEVVVRVPGCFSGTCLKESSW
ncbi:predicted protein [Postia placenta Mad-698-R]|nr:predicted protein [Postia placenta Mad-698-R]